LQEEAVILVVAAEPDVIANHANAVLLLRPFVALRLARPTPGLHHVALGIELDDRWRRHAAFGARRLLRGRGFQPRQRTGALHDPDVIALVDRDAGDLAERPVVRQRLRPRRIDLEFRHVGGDRESGYGQQNDARQGKAYGL